MKDYATISVPRDVKKELESMKGRREWGEFLAELAHESKGLKAQRAFEELSAMLSEDELNRIEVSSKEFREGLKLR